MVETRGLVGMIEAADAMVKAANVIFVGWIFYALGAAAVIVLRRKLPDTTRPYRTWGYPVTPILYAAASLVVLVVLASQLDPSLFLAAVWFVGALGVHHLFMRNRAPVPPMASGVASPEL